MSKEPLRLRVINLQPIFLAESAFKLIQISVHASDAGRIGPYCRTIGCLRSRYGF